MNNSEGLVVNFQSLQIYPLPDTLSVDKTALSIYLSFDDLGRASCEITLEIMVP
jgi:hypothetical protein